MLIAPFCCLSPPPQPRPAELVLPPMPGLTWLLRGRKRRWEAACEEAQRAHAQEEENKQARWRESVATHNESKTLAERKHEEKRKKFIAEQEKFNLALNEFRQRFEAGHVEAIKEYCSRVLERSQYPEPLTIGHEVEFDAESKYVVVNLELPSQDRVPSVGGYKFVSKGNRSDPIPLKTKEAVALHNSILDQIIVRTMHEVFEGCYIDSVAGAIVNGWVTSLNKATGQDERKQVRCIASDRATFEAFDLSRVEPAACVAKLSENVGQMSGAAR